MNRPASPWAFVAAGSRTLTAAATSQQRDLIRSPLVAPKGAARVRSVAAPRPDARTPRCRIARGMRGALDVPRSWLLAAALLGSALPAGSQPPASAGRERVLKQVRVPLHYYYREMY